MMRRSAPRIFILRATVYCLARFGIRASSLMRNRLGITFRELFVVSLLILAMLLGTLFYEVYVQSRRSVTESALREREEIASRKGDMIVGFLDGAQTTLENVERSLASGLAGTGSADEIEALLFSEVLNNSGISEATFTHGESLGYIAGGSMRLSPANRWQLSVYRGKKPDGSLQIMTRRVARWTAVVLSRTFASNPSLRRIFEAYRSTRPFSETFPTQATTLLFKLRSRVNSTAMQSGQTCTMCRSTRTFPKASGV